MEKFNVAVGIIRGLNNKQAELMKELKSAKLDVAIICVKKKKRKRSKELGNFVLLYSEVKSINGLQQG